MELEELKKVVKQEEETRYENLKLCLFGGTEHLHGGGLNQALNYINELIDEGFIPVESLLRSIGQYCDNKIKYAEKE